MAEWTGPATLAAITATATVATTGGRTRRTSTTADFNLFSKTKKNYIKPGPCMCISIFSPIMSQKQKTANPYYSYSIYKHVTVSPSWALQNYESETKKDKFMISEYFLL